MITCGLIRRIIQRPPLTGTASNTHAALKVLTEDDGTSQENRRAAIRRAHETSIAALRQDGQTWATIAALLGLSASRVRDIYSFDGGATCASIDDASILDNLRLFCEQVGGSSPTRRAYARWPGRAVSPATVENRFGGWRPAIDRACAGQRRW